MKNYASGIDFLTMTRVVLCVMTLGIAPVSAFAYLDPGTGSLLFQSLLAVLFGIGVAFRQLRAWISRAWSFVLRRPVRESKHHLGETPGDTDE